MTIKVKSKIIVRIFWYAVLLALMLFLLKACQPFGFSLASCKEIFKRNVEKYTPFILEEKDTKKKYPFAKEPGFYIACSEPDDFGLKDYILPEDKPVLIKSDSYLQLGIANLSDKTLKDPFVEISLPDGVIFYSNFFCFPHWRKIKSNKRYRTKPQDINPGTIGCLSPMGIRMEKANTPYKIDFIIVGEDIIPIRRSIIIESRENRG